MERPAVIGVPRRAEAAPLPAAVPAPGFDQVQARAAIGLLLLAVARWCFVGTPSWELLMLVPLWFTGVPVMAWAAGLGVSYWSKGDAEFVAIDAMARPLLAKAMLAVEMVASGFFAVAFFAVRITADCGGG